jgi:hypothetical protein
VLERRNRNRGVRNTWKVQGEIRIFGKTKEKQKKGHVGIKPNWLKVICATNIIQQRNPGEIRVKDVGRDRYKGKTV